MAIVKLVGGAPNQVPRNKDLGNLAFQDAQNIAGPVSIGGALTINGTTTLTSTATLTANPVLSGGTANGVTYLNGSKVLTSGSALTFNGTRFSTYVTSNSNQNIARFGVQNTANTDDAFLDIYADAANNLVTLDSTGNNTGSLAFNLGGSEQMRLTSTGLGIGTSSPAYKLHVSGESLVTGKSYIGASSVYLDFSSGGLTFATSNTVKATLDSSGNLGLGITPSAWAAGRKALQIGANAYGALQDNGAGSFTVSRNYFTDGTSKYIANGTASIFSLENSGAFAWFTAPSGTAGNAISFTQAMTLTGTSSPSLLVGTTVSLQGYAFQAPNQNGFSIQNSANSANIAQFAGGGNVALTGAGSFAVINGTDGILFGGNVTERARIDSAGNLGLGTTPSAWQTSSYKVLQVNKASLLSEDVTALRLNQNYYIDSAYTSRYISTGFASFYIQASGSHAWHTAPSGTAGSAVAFTQVMSLDATGNLLVGGTTSSNRLTVTGSGSSDVSVFISPTGGTGVKFTRFTVGAGLGTEVGSVSYNGASGVLYNVTSDQRLKVNIQDASPASSLIDSLQVRQYDWKVDGSHQRYGFVAQELVTVVPEAVHQPNNPEDMMAVDYSKLVPILVKEIQSLRARLAAAGI
jgi:hypothetical protein